MTSQCFLNMWMIYHEYPGQDRDAAYFAKYLLKIICNFKMSLVHKVISFSLESLQQLLGH